MLLAALLPVFAANAAMTLENQPSAPVPKQNDTVNAIKYDTTGNIPLKNHGRTFLLPYKAYRKINKADILMTNYTSFPGLLKQVLKYYPLDPGIYGQFNTASVFGGNAGDVAVRFDGRQMNDPDFSTYNLEMIAPEFMENAEIFTGSDAVILSGNSSGALINIQEPIYNTRTPFTKLWYCQGGYNFMGSDGVFSQNLNRDINFTLGFRGMSSDGKYSNSALESWNVRGILRWNPSNRTSVSLTEQFTNHGINTFGGINKNKTPDLASDISSVLNFYGLAEKTFRHDITLAMSSYLAADSISAFSGSVYYSNILWNRNTGGDFYFDGADSSTTLNYTNYMLGAQGKFEQVIIPGYFVLRTGGEVNYLSIPKNALNNNFSGWNLAGFAHGELTPSKSIVFRGGTRYSRTYGEDAISFGGSALFSLNNKISVLGDISYSLNQPAPSMTGNGLKNEKNALILGEVNYRSGDFSAGVNAYSRITDSPLLYRKASETGGVITRAEAYNAESRHALGMGIETGFSPIAHIHLDGYANFSYTMTDSKSDERLPYLYAGISGYYELIIKKSVLHAGADLSMTSPFKGESLLPWQRAYIPNGNSSDFAYDGINLFLALKLGNAYVKLDFKNALGSTYYYVPYYPQYGRIFQLSVNMSFND